MGLTAEKDHRVMNHHADVIARIKSVAHDVLPAGARLILYGSRARGDAREDSDWDLLVLLDKPRLEKADYDNITYPFTYLGWNIGEAITPVMYTTSEWQANDFTPFYKNVQREGIAMA